jgi:acrylyl-CoA reductase (NADPH)
MRPYEDRVAAWNRIVTDLSLDKLDAMVSEHGLADMPALGTSILEGGVKGRVVVNPNL